MAVLNMQQEAVLKPVSAPAPRFFFEGDAYFEALERSIRGAARTIDLEIYYLASDSFGWNIANLLAAKARAGVAVRVIADAVGSRGTSVDLFAALELAGVSLKLYNPIFPYWRNLGRRDHRKMLIVDGESAFVGGFNLSAEYSSRFSGAAAWRDTGVQLDQPELVEDLRHIFEEAWHESDRSLRRFFKVRRERPQLNPGHLQIIPNYGRRRKSLIRREYLKAIRGARHGIDISNPYFIPDLIVLRALRQAGRRGVKVRILTAGEKTDVRVARWAGQATYSGLLRTGARIFEYRERMMHAKSAVVDGAWFTVGTANIDHMSFFKNLEVNLFGTHVASAQVLTAQFEEDLKESREILRPAWKKRSWLAKWRERFFFWFREWL